MLLKKIVTLIFGFITIFAGVYFIGMQVSYLLLNKLPGITTDLNYLFPNGSNAYFWFLNVIGLYFWLNIVLTLFFSKRDRMKRKEQRRLSKDEKRQFSHLATVYETKKGLQRLAFNGRGEKNHLHFPFLQKNMGWFTIHSPLILLIILQLWMLALSFQERRWIYYPIINIYLLLFFSIEFSLIIGVIARGHVKDLYDDLFDGLKKKYNGLLFFLNNNKIHRFDIKDIHKLNTKKKWMIDGQVEDRRGGLPILTYKNVIYIDPTDSHTIIIGTTNSGKTFGLIHPLIENLRMAGENMVINDLKGELYLIHAEQLKKSGYKVVVINLVDPKKSTKWNPLGLVISKYRIAQAMTNEVIEQNETLKLLKRELQSCQNELIRCGLDIVNESKKDSPNQSYLEAKVKQMKKLKSLIKEKQDELPQPDFSEAFELLKDIAVTICVDVNAKDPFWTSQAAILLEGLVAFLLEETTIDEEGNEIPLPDKMINFKSVKLLLNQGMTSIGESGQSQFALKSYMDMFRTPDSHSVMKLSEFLGTSQNTRGSISSVFGDKLDITILNENIVKMMDSNQFDFQDFNNRKTAVFIIVHDEKKTYYPLVTVFMKQLYEEIIKVSRKEDSQRLRIPLNIVWDEFGISPALKDIDSIFAAARSRGVRFNCVIQSFAQLDHNYGEKTAKSIRNNVMNTVYLLGGDSQTVKEISERAGNKLIWNKENDRFDKVPVLSEERLNRLDLGEAVILRQRCYPILTRYYPYDKYIFYRQGSHNAKLFEREGLDEKVSWFDLENALEKRKQRLQRNSIISTAKRKPNSYNDKKHETKNNDSKINIFNNKQSNKSIETNEESVFNESDLYEY